MISLDNVITRKDENLMGGEMGNETVMMDMETGDYLGLNEVGTSIWKIIATPTNVSNICEQLLEEYNIERSACQAETLKYLEELKKESLIEVR